MGARDARIDGRARCVGAILPSQRREYVEWITDAKSETTRLRRLEQAVEWIAEGKPRHRKYQKLPTDTPRSGR